MQIPKVIIGALWLLGGAFYVSANGDLLFAGKIREMLEVDGGLPQAVVATFVGITFWLIASWGMSYNAQYGKVSR
jgi:hypothetical protein